MNADVHALTGAYVLDAVSEDERVEFERHLRECETCAQEVRELRETATRLGRAAAVVPPPELRASVLARVGQVRQDPPQASVVPLRRRGGSLATRLTSAAAAVLLVVASVLGVLLAQARGSVQDAEARAAAMATILRAGDARISSQGDEDSGRMTVLSSRSADRALLLADNLPAPPAGHDYQAWTIDPRAAHPAGLLPEGGNALLEVDDLGAATTVGITIEPDGGSAEPSAAPIMEFDVT
jgi:anti-sigma-K factor RskA